MYRDFVDSREGFDAQTEAEYNAHLDQLALDDYDDWDADEDGVVLDDEDDHDGQPTMYEEYQDLYGGDDWDHGQYDCEY